MKNHELTFAQSTEDGQSTYPGRDYSFASNSNEATQALEIARFYCRGKLGGLLATPVCRELMMEGLANAFKPLLAEPACVLSTTHLLQTVMDDFMARLEAPRFSFPARSEGQSFLVTLPNRSNVRLTPEMAIYGRLWGSGLQFACPEEQLTYEAVILRDALHELGRDVHSIWRLWFTGRLSGIRLPEASDLGCRFEQLVQDILNEDGLVATRASLYEDTLEFSDLRVHYDGLGRRRGARVQVKLTANPEDLNRLAEQYATELYVLLTPISLSRYFRRLVETDPTFDGGAVFDALGISAADERELAHAFREIFVQALSKPAQHPLGPAGLLPKALTRFVQRFCREQAFRSTALLRSLQSAGQEPSESRRMPGGWRRSIRKHAERRTALDSCPLVRPVRV